MKFLICLFLLSSLNAFSSMPNVEKIFADHDKNQDLMLKKSEHRKVFKEYRTYISQCLGLYKEQEKLEFLAYLYTVRWKELPRVDSSLTFFSFYGTYFIQFTTTKKEMQSFINICESN